MKKLSLAGYKVVWMHDIERDSIFIKLEARCPGNENGYFSEVRELDSKTVNDFCLNQTLKEMAQKMERKLALDSISKKKRD